MAAALEKGDLDGPVVIFRDVGAGLPVFVAHDHQGSIFPARGLLTAMEADQPIYGFRAAAREGRAIEQTSLQELASGYAREVPATVGDEGRVVVFGHASGSVLAFEIARQLSAPERRWPCWSSAPVGLRRSSRNGSC